MYRVVVYVERVDRTPDGKVLRTAVINRDTVTEQDLETRAIDMVRSAVRSAKESG
jgi:hypothetical protein